MNRYFFMAIATLAMAQSSTTFTMDGGMGGAHTQLPQLGRPSLFIASQLVYKAAGVQCPLPYAIERPFESGRQAYGVPYKTVYCPTIGVPLSRRHGGKFHHLYPIENSYDAAMFYNGYMNAQKKCPRALAVVLFK